MATSGTNTFNLDIEQIIEKAYRLVGGELTSGEDLKQARRSLDLLLIDLQNRGHPLAKLEKVTQTVTAGTVSYALAANVVDVLDVVLTRDSVDTPMERLSLFEYHQLPKKTQQGRPTQFTLDRDRAQPTLYLYLAPDNSTDVIDMWVVKRIEDSGNFTNDIDLSYRYLPAIVFGLAYFVSLERANIHPQKRMDLKSQYLESLEGAFGEDRERAGFTVTPHNYYR